MASIGSAAQDEMLNDKMKRTAMAVRMKRVNLMKPSF
jgi:hypothetical protein